MNTVLSLAHPAPAAPPVFDIDAATHRLADALAATAVERDRIGGHAATPRALIRRSGLLALSVPALHGGLDADWPTVYRVTRRLARVDGALAHVFGIHHLQVATLLLHGKLEQQARLLRQTIGDRLFWGHASDPIERDLVATRVEGGWRLGGSTSVTAGALGSDRLTVSAQLPAGDGMPPPWLSGCVATRSRGLFVHDDGDAFGQRQADSGSAHFEEVFLAERDVLLAPRALPMPRATLHTLVAQLMRANLCLGIGEGAFEAARDTTRARPAGDPFVQHRGGSLWLLIRPAQLAVEAAARQLQAALDRGTALRIAERDEVAVAVAEAQVLAQRAGLEVSSQLLELTGAGSTSSQRGLDRFWRNARVLALHDPVDEQLRGIGRFRLEGREAGPDGCA